MREGVREQRSGEGASYRLTGLCRGEGSSGVDISRGEHGDDGVSNTASVACRVAATGEMGDKGEQRRQRVVLSSSPPGRGVCLGEGHG